MEVKTIEHDGWTIIQQSERDGIGHLVPVNVPDHELKAATLTASGKTAVYWWRVIPSVKAPWTVAELQLLLKDKLSKGP